MRRKRLVLNTIVPLIHQFTAIICGFILPRLIIKNYGTEVNGLTASITQYLHIIAFMEMGIGAVVQSNLYKPLVKKDEVKISQIWVSANKFFRKIASIFLVYIIILVFVFPYAINNKFDFLYSATLIVAMSISMFAQYYFGIVNKLLLNADQKSYIQYLTVSITLVINTIACAILIHFNLSIQVVKLTTSLIFLIQPIVLNVYVRKNYKINREIVYENEPIKQKWNGLAQHISSVVLDSTDTIVLSILSTLSAVSVYSVYHLVIYGVRKIFQSLTKGIESVLGELIAKHDEKGLEKFFGWVEFCVHNGIVLIFGCTSILLIPFVKVYTSGITDTNYIFPLFGVLMTMAQAMYCMRLPYNLVVHASGHYKETQNNYIMSAILNLLISIIAVKLLGLVGVAIGTLVAMSYQTFWIIWYDTKNLLSYPLKKIVKQFFVDAIIIIIAVLICDVFKLDLRGISYFSWCILAIKVMCIWIVVIITINLVFYRSEMLQLKNRICKRIYVRGKNVK